jgi:DNA polymerase II small subunit
VELQGDITGTSKCIGEYSDFVKYFRDRYGRLREMFSGRVNARPIESIGKKTADRDISIIGMVLDIRTTAKGHRVVELEDPTGIVSVILQKGSSAFDQSANIVTDEVIGVTGTTDGNGRIFAKSFVWPDIPSQNAPLEDAEGAALFLSDLHVGSKFFLEDAWIRFISWIKGELDDPMGLRENVRYLVIAGDLVDGVGVYPGQENDLAVNDINCQYEQAAEYLGQIPDNICIVISPGNHDAVRLAEPQPALPATFQGLFKKSCVFVGNPAWVSLGGRNCLIYHGRSIDDLVLKVPGISYGEPEKAMVEMLKRRHLAPIYGSRVSIAPEEVDHLVIQRPPSIFHCGHVHAVGITRYKGVTVINSGTWQSQTEYQKKMNLQPTPGIVPYVDLETMRVRKLQFA